MEYREPKVLLFDTENTPNLGYIWAKYQQDVIDYEHEWYMLCFSYKWMGQKKIYNKSLPDYKLYKKEPTNDRELITDLWKLFDEADIIIAHNGDKFDIRKTNAKFLEHKLPVPSSYKTVDTLKIARKYFYLNSNKLDDIGKHLNIGRKIEVNKFGGFGLWKACMDGNKKAWKTMTKYCNQDVKLLEDVYNELKKWHVSHPDLTLYTGKRGCCKQCQSKRLQKRGYEYLKVKVYQRLFCLDCGKWQRGEEIKPNKDGTK